MPELPEVETIVKQLDKILSGKIIRNVEVLREKSFSEGFNSLKGKEIGRVGRLAKMIVIHFKGWDRVLAVHLKMTGQLIYVEQSKRTVGGHPTGDWVGKLPSSHTRVIVGFTDKSTLYFNDQRVFGWMRLFTSDELRVAKEKLPPDVVDPEFTLKYFVKSLAGSRRAVKLVILDQAKMGGVGNIYANDALFLARLDPKKPANTLTKGQAGALHKAIIKVINKGIETGGATYSHFVDTAGIGGKYQEHFLTYDKEGKPCPRKGCGGVIKKFRLGGRGTYFCSICQK